MDIGTFVTWIVVGLAAGWLAGRAIKDEGYGLRVDLLLGIIGSCAVSGAVWALGGSPDTGRALTAVIGFGGAALVIVAQRTLHPALAATRTRAVRRSGR